MPYVLNPTTGQLDWTNAAGATLPIAESDVTNLTTDLAGKQPLDSDLTAIAALTTTAYGRALLELADAAAGRTALGLGTASTHATTDYDASGAAAAAQSASQPLDSDLTAIAALTTTSFGRSLLAQADAAATRSTIGAGTSSVTLPITESDVTSLTSDLATKAPLASPTFTGHPVGVTETALDGSTNLASTAYADRAAAVASAASGLAPTGVTFQNYDRHLVTTSLTPASGTLRLQAIWLPKGFTVASISFMSSATALVTSGTGPHFWFALFDSSRALLRQSNDDTAATWAQNTLKTVNLSSTFPTTYAGLHYIGLMVVSGSTGTQPTINSYTSVSVGPVNLAPILGGTSSTGQTTTAPNPAAAITTTGGQVWGGVA